MFTGILDIPYRFTTDVEEFKAFIGTKISYTQQPVEDEIFFKSKDLLFEKGIRSIDLAPKMYDGMLGFFRMSQESAMPFDPFAASFYLLSRYEEYLPYSPDEHGRYPLAQSVLSKPDWLMKPWVDIWAYHIKDLLLKRYPNAVFGSRKFKYISTIDVDQAYAYKHKGFLRSAGTMARQVLSLNGSGLVDQAKVLISGSQDPFNSFDEILAWHRDRAIELKFFIHVGDYGVLDQSIAYTHPAFRLQVKSVADYCSVGIHPSYNASFSLARKRGEKLRLEQMIHREVVESRQHFLRLKLPETYRDLIDLEIKRDYTMGFSEHPGFRAGTCTPFNFFDLLYEVPTKLTLMPTAIMDAGLKHYLHLSPTGAKTIIDELVANVKAVDGTLISLWHNNSVTDYQEWKGWKEVFHHLLDQCK